VVHQLQREDVSGRQQQGVTVEDLKIDGRLLMKVIPLPLSVNSTPLSVNPLPLSMKSAPLSLNPLPLSMNSTPLIINPPL
jgi:hypothetical protein